MSDKRYSGSNRLLDKTSNGAELVGMARPRLTRDDYEARLADYCARHGVRPTGKGFPPYPAGGRETPQHHAWIALHRLHDRLSRRERGQCQRCAEPPVEGGLHCTAHVAAASSGLEPALRAELHAAQGRLCPVCERAVDVLEARLFERPRASGSEPQRVLLHADCLRLVTMVEAAGPGALARLRRFLGPEGGARRRGAA